jgi:hypothetical protein
MPPGAVAPGTFGDRAATENVGGRCQAASMSRSSEFDRAALNATLARQYQVISRSQAMANGMTNNALAHRLRAAGPWQRLLPGVYLTVSCTSHRGRSAPSPAR